MKGGGQDTGAIPRPCIPATAAAARSGLSRNRGAFSGPGSAAPLSSGAGGRSGSAGCTVACQAAPCRHGRCAEG